MVKITGTHINVRKRLEDLIDKAEDLDIQTF